MPLEEVSSELPPVEPIAMMEDVQLDVEDIPRTPSPAARTKKSSLSRSPSSGRSSPPSSPPPPPTEINNSTSTSPVRPTSMSIGSDNEVGLNEEGGGGPDKSGKLTGKLASIRFKKQCSKIGRLKTKILQNLGKADKTTDELFEEYEINFNKQQNNANRFHKELANYLRCARALHGASKSLFETLMEVYEPDWVGHDLLYVQAQNSDMLWTDFCHKVQDQSLAPLTHYMLQFPELKKKIDKRGRKLVDYDSQRHQLENLERSARRDEYKIARSRDQLEIARTTYEGLNKELYDEIPGVHDQRIPHVADGLQTLFAAETTFMHESAKIAQELEAIGEKLSKEDAKGTYKTKRGVPVAPRPLSLHSPVSPVTSNNPSVRPTISGPVSPKEEIGRPYEEIEFEDKKVNGTTSIRSNGEIIGTKIPPGGAEHDPTCSPSSLGATTEGLPADVLYRVRATYKYTREDVDELGFDVGEVINVVEYDDPEEQEEGWLCGVKDGTTEKGLFPANFTRPI